MSSPTSVSSSYNTLVDYNATDQPDRDFGLIYEELDEMRQGQPVRKRRKRVIGRAKLRAQILQRSNIIITTLSGAGSKAFIEAASRRLDNSRRDSEFDAVIIDEACVASEPETLSELFLYMLCMYF